MIKAASNKVLIISCILSLCFHCAVFFWFQFFHSPHPVSPETDSPGAFFASLTYTDPLPALPRMNTKQPDSNRTGPIHQPENRDVATGNINSDPGPDISEAGAPDISAVEFPDSENSFQGTTESGDNDKDSLPGKEPGGSVEQDVNVDSFKAILLNGLQKKIEAYKTYPPGARRRGLEGTVVLFIILDNKGNLLDCRIRESSGHRILDKAAVEMVKRILPYPHTIGRSVEITIPIVYRLL